MSFFCHGSSTSHTIEVRIHYEDTDCGGVVYYANYLRYFERARTAHLESLGIDMKKMTEARHFFMVTHAELDYQRAARYGDRLLIESRLAEVGGASLIFDHVVTESEGKEKKVTGRVRLASVGADGKILRFPPDMLARLRGRLPA